MNGDFKKRGETYFRKQKKLQETYGVLHGYKMVFQGHAKPPLRARFALWLLRSCNAQMVDYLHDTKK